MLPKKKPKRDCEKQPYIEIEKYDFPSIFLTLFLMGLLASIAVYGVYAVAGVFLILTGQFVDANGATNYSQLLNCFAIVWVIVLTAFFMFRLFAEDLFKKQERHYVLCWGVRE